MTGSPGPRIRVAGGLALLAFVGVGGFLLARRSTVLGKLAVGLLALNGRVEGGRYFMTEHGRETETRRARFWLVATFETVAFVAWPVLYLIAAYNEHAAGRERARRRAARSDDAPRVGAGRDPGRKG